MNPVRNGSVERKPLSCLIDLLRLTWKDLPGIMLKVANKACNLSGQFTADPITIGIVLPRGETPDAEATFGILV